MVARGRTVDVVRRERCAGWSSDARELHGIARVCSTAPDRRLRANAERRKRRGSLDLARQQLAVVAHLGAERVRHTVVDDRSRDRVPVDVVRPDDDAVTEALREMRGQAGEGVGSQASSEVVPDALDLAVRVAPGRPAQRARVTGGQRAPPARGRPRAPTSRPSSSADGASTRPARRAPRPHVRPACSGR